MFFLNFDLVEGGFSPLSPPLVASLAIFGATSIFNLWSRAWGVARLLGLRGVLPRPHLSEIV